MSLDSTSGGPPPGVVDGPLRPSRCNALLLSFLSFCLIVFGVWVVSAGKRYREEYAQGQGTEGWSVGSTQAVQLTLVRDDKHNLGCASDQIIAGLRCGYHRNGSPVGASTPDDDAQILRPYNTVGSELLLGAGLWTSPGLKKPLPAARFTVVCNYHIEGVAKLAAIRFDPAAPFAPAGRSLTAGTLSDCTLPQ
jgi:hypothetical protein